jgi:RNA polymerase sigma-70 factor (ECF subfamily)
LNCFCEKESIAIQQCQGGSAKAFEAIVKKYMKQAYFIALGLVGNHDDAMDLSQEAFFRAYSNIDRFNPKRKFFPWFYQILKNLCFSHLRKGIYRKHNSLETVDEGNVSTQVNPQFNPSAIAERNETKDLLWQAISQLNEKHREVIILRHFQDLSYEQIAQIIMCARGTVMSRLYHARKELKCIMNKQKGGQKQ